MDQQVNYYSFCTDEQPFNTPSTCTLSFFFLPCPFSFSLLPRSLLKKPLLHTPFVIFDHSPSLIVSASPVRAGGSVWRLCLLLQPTQRRTDEPVSALGLDELQICDPGEICTRTITKRRSRNFCFLWKGTRALCGSCGGGYIAAGVVFDSAVHLFLG